MLNVSGICKITKLKSVGEKMVSATLYYGVKKKDSEEWDNHFYNAKIVGKALNYMIENDIMDKDTIQINSAILETRQHEGKTYTSIVVFDIERYVAPTKEVDKNEGKKSKKW